MKRRAVLARSLAAAACFVLSALPASAADNGTVTARVTVASPCILLGTTAIDFGVATFSQPGQSPVQVDNQVATIESCNPAPQVLFARGTNASAADGSGASWNLLNAAPCPGPNSFLLVNVLGTLGGVALTQQIPVVTTDARFDALGGGPFQMAGNTQLRAFQRLYMPCAGSSGAGKTMTFDTVYTATN